MGLFRNKGVIMRGYVSFILIAVLLVASLSACEGKIDPFEYLTVSYSGYNTDGEVNVNFNRDQLIGNLIGEQPMSLEGLGEWLSEYQRYSSGIELSFFPKDGLKNGDIVTVTITTSGEAAEKIRSGDKTFTVDGLQNVPTIDMFKDIEVVFSGINGEGKVEIVLLTEEEALSACDFYFSQKYGVSNGDVVTVGIRNAETVEESYEILLKSTEKDYTVSGLSEYLTDAGLLPIEEIQKYAATYLSEYGNKEDNWLFSYSDTRYYSTWFLVAKHEGFNIDQNALKVFLSYDEYYDGEYRETIYVWLDFPNLTVTSDGKVDISYDMGYSLYFTSDINEYREELEEDYIVYEVVLN